MNSIISNKKTVQLQALMESMNVANPPSLPEIRSFMNSSVFNSNEQKLAFQYLNDGADILDEFERVRIHFKSCLEISEIQRIPELPFLVKSENILQSASAI